MTAPHCLSDIELTGTIGQNRNANPSARAYDALVQAAGKPVAIKRELAATLLIENRNAVLIGTNLVFFGAEGEATILPLTPSQETPATPPSANRVPTTQIKLRPEMRKENEVKGFTAPPLPRRKKIHLVTKS